MNIKIEAIGGLCPVQAEGEIGGIPFYFCSRGEHWSMSIGFDPVGICLGKALGWKYEESYGSFPDAGYISQTKALAFMYKAFSKYLEFLAEEESNE